MSMSMSTSAAPRGSARSTVAYSGKAMIGLAAAIVALLAPLPFGLLAAVVAMIAAILSRRDLRDDPGLRGTAASLIAFLVGVGVLLFGAIPAISAVLPFLL